MTVINPNFPEKKRAARGENRPTQYGNISSTRKRQLYILNSGSPAWGSTWRVLLICAMIDLPIWAYFNFVKNISMWEGLQQVRNEIQMKINPPKTAHNKEENHLKIEAEEANRKFLEKRMEIIKKETIAAETNEIKLAEPKQFKGAVYSWNNEKGVRIFSNTGFPKDGKYTDGKIEIQ